MISIIGAGPSGNYLAYLLAKNNNEVNVYEEHEEIGSPVQCTGILTSEVEEFVELKNKFVVNKINQARIFAPNGGSLHINFKKEDIIVDRKEFDKHLASLAMEAGAKYFLKHRYENNNGNKIKINNNVKETDFIVGADGPFSRVAKENGLWCNRKFVTGSQVTIKAKCDPKVVNFWLGNGLFGWSVPENEETARVGVVANDDPRLHLNKLLEKIENKGKIISQEVGRIPLYNPKQKLQKNNVYLVGDAAMQVKATSFGGIVYGLKAAKILSQYFNDYERKCKQEIGRDLYLSLMIRKAMNNFSDNNYNELVEMFNKNKLKTVLETKSRDYPSKFILDLILAEPRLLKFATKLI